MRAQAYTTLIRPVLEYASTVWDPHQIQLIQQIEQVQRQAACFATGDYYSRDPGCVTNMLNKLQWEPLQHRRAKSKVIMLYKTFHQEVEIPIQHLLVTNTRVTRGTQANNIKANQHPGRCIQVFLRAILPSRRGTDFHLKLTLPRQWTASGRQSRTWSLSTSPDIRPSCF